MLEVNCAYKHAMYENVCVEKFAHVKCKSLFMQDWQMDGWTQQPAGKTNPTDYIDPHVTHLDLK